MKKKTANKYCGHQVGWNPFPSDEISLAERNHLRVMAELKKMRKEIKELKPIKKKPKVHL
jgi:hypothetical protein